MTSHEERLEDERRAMAYQCAASVACTGCGAAAWDPCLTKSKRRTRAHAPRWYSGWTIAANAGWNRERFPSEPEPEPPPNETPSAACYESDDGDAHCWHFDRGAAWQLRDKSPPHKVTCCDCGREGEVGGVNRLRHGPHKKGYPLERKVYRPKVTLKVLKGGQE